MSGTFVQRVFIARSGAENADPASWENASASKQGHAATVLSPAGLEQARKLGEYLREKGVTRIFTGVTDGSLATAELVRDEVGDSCKAHGGLELLYKYAETLDKCSEASPALAAELRAAIVTLRQWQTEALKLCDRPTETSRDPQVDQHSVTNSGVQESEEELFVTDVTTRLSNVAWVSPSCERLTSCHSRAMWQAESFCGEQQVQACLSKLAHVQLVARDATHLAMSRIQQIAVNHPDFARYSAQLLDVFGRLQRFLSVCHDTVTECAKDCSASPESVRSTLTLILRVVVASATLLVSLSGCVTGETYTAEVSLQARLASQALEALLGRCASEHVAFICDSAAVVHLLTHALDQGAEKAVSAIGSTWAGVPSGSLTELRLLRGGTQKGRILKVEVVRFAQPLVKELAPRARSDEWISCLQNISDKWNDSFACWAPQFMNDEHEETFSLEDDTEVQEEGEPLLQEDGDEDQELNNDPVVASFKALCGRDKDVEVNQAAWFACTQGLAPSPDELAEWSRMNGPRLTRKQLHHFLNHCRHKEDNVDNLMSIFSYHDPTMTGYVSRFTFMTLLSMGSQHPEAAEHCISALLSRFGLDGGKQVNYKAFAEKLLQPSQPCAPGYSAAYLRFWERAGSSQETVECVQTTSPSVQPSTSAPQTGGGGVSSWFSSFFRDTAPQTPAAEEAPLALTESVSKKAAEEEDDASSPPTTAATTVPLGVECQTFIDFAGSDTAMMSAERAIEAANSVCSLRVTKSDLLAFGSRVGDGDIEVMEMQTFSRFVEFLRQRQDLFVKSAKAGRLSVTEAGALLPRFTQNASLTAHSVDIRHFSRVTGLESLDYIAFNDFVDFVERRHALFRRQAAEDDLGDKIRKVHVTKLCHLFGVAPSLEDEEKMLDEVPENINYAALMDFLMKCEHAEDTVPYLQQFFSLFDQQTHGKMSRTSLVNLLSTWGEKLSPEQAEQIVRLFGDDAEVVDCQQFVTNIMEHDLPSPIPRQTRA